LCGETVHLPRSSEEITAVLISLCLLCYKYHAEPAFFTNSLQVPPPYTWHSQQSSLFSSWFPPKLILANYGETELLFSRASAAWTAAVELPGKGSWHTGKKVSLSQTELLW